MEKEVLEKELKAIIKKGTLLYYSMFLLSEKSKVALILYWSQGRTLIEVVFLCAVI